MADVWGAKHVENQETYVEGVGNEVLLGLGASCIAIVIPILVSVLVKRTSNIQIHPDEAENVRATRETLGVVGENADTTNQDTDENERPTPPRNINAGEPCPICLAQPILLIITNCGHGFCEYGDMVQCDLCDNWYHLPCLNLSSFPENDQEWLCHSCVPPSKLCKND